MNKKYRTIVTTANPVDIENDRLRLALHNSKIENAQLLEFVRLAAVGVRSDGTYNRCREALEIAAKELLKSIGES